MYEEAHFTTDFLSGSLKYLGTSWRFKTLHSNAESRYAYTGNILKFQKFLIGRAIWWECEEEFPNSNEYTSSKVQTLVLLPLHLNFNKLIEIYLLLPFVYFL